jgi:hypothetical protein
MGNNMKQSFKLAAVISLGVLLTACGSYDENTEDSSSDNSGSENYTTVTGINASSAFAYYDLDTNTQLELTDEQAGTNTEWDMAFYSTSIILNGNASGSGDVKAFFTANNSDFYDVNGDAVVDKFTSATPETELEDFLAVTEYAASTDFIYDQLDTIFGTDFYSYNFTNHEITANDGQYYLLKSGETYYKVRVTSASNLDGGVAGSALTEFTIGFQEKATDDQTFSAEQAIQIAQCDTQHYFDFSANSDVTESDAWDISVLCDSIEVQLGDGVEAYAFVGDETTDNAVVAAPDDSLKSDTLESVFKNQFPWYKYNLEGNHKMWSQYGVYFVQTPNDTYKLQVTSYYGLVDGEVTTRQISFIYDTVESAVE